MSETPENRMALVACNGRPARVEVVGEGEPVVFIGTAVPMAWSAPAAHALAHHGYQVVNFDYQAPEGWDLEPEPRSALDQVTDVIEVMTQLGLERGHVIGLSRGAITAYGVATRHPERTNKLVLAFPVSGHADTIHTPQQPVGEANGEAEDPMQEALLSVFSAEFVQDHHDEALSLLASPPGTVIRLDRFEEEPFFSARDSFSGAALVIEGGSDRIVGPEHPARYRSAIPGAEYILIDGASHGWLMEQPARFAHIISGFLGGSSNQARLGPVH